VYNVLGGLTQLIVNIKNTQDVELDLSGCKDGIINLEILTNGGIVFQKVVLNR
jgi:hypothetical protein